MHCELELFPMDKRSDYRFNMAIEPLQITYDAVSREQREHTRFIVFSI